MKNNAISSTLYSNMYLKTSTTGSQSRNNSHFERISFEYENVKESNTRLKLQLSDKTREIKILKANNNKTKEEMQKITKVLSNITKYSDQSTTMTMPMINNSIDHPDSNIIQHMPLEKICLSKAQQKSLNKLEYITEFNKRLMEQKLTIETQQKEIKELKEMQMTPNMSRYDFFMNNKNKLYSVIEENDYLKRDNEDLKNIMNTIIERLSHQVKFCSIFHQKKSSRQSRVIENDSTSYTSKTVNNNTNGLGIDSNSRTSSNNGNGNNLQGSIKDSLKIAEIEMQKLQKKNYELNDINEENQRQLKYLKADYDKLQANRDEQVDILMKIRKKNKDLINEVNELKIAKGIKAQIDEIEEYKAKNEEMEGQLMKMIEINKNLHDDINRNENLFEEERNKLVKYEEKIAEYDNLIKENEEKKEKIKKENLELKRENKELNEMKRIYEEKEMKRIYDEEEKNYEKNLNVCEESKIKNELYLTHSNLDEKQKVIKEKNESIEEYDHKENNNAKKTKENYEEGIENSNSKHDNGREEKDDSDRDIEYLIKEESEQNGNHQEYVSSVDVEDLKSE